MTRMRMRPMSSEWLCTIEAKKLLIFETVPKASTLFKRVRSKIAVFEIHDFDLFLISIYQGTVPR